MMNFNEEIVHSFINAFNENNLDAALEHVTDDCIYHNIPMPVVQGKEMMRNTLSLFTGMADEIDWVTMNIAEAQSGVVLTERLDRFHVNGRWVELPVMGIFEIVDGKISHWRDYFDLQQFQSQMAG